MNVERRRECHCTRIADDRIVILTESPEETRRIGVKLGSILEKGDIVALMGDLGSGKTVLTQGIALGLEVSDEYAVTSPTFTLINEYPPGRMPLYHLDLYRLSGEKELTDLGYEEYFYGEGATVVEWAEKIRGILPAGAWLIRLSHKGEQEREIEICGIRSRLERLIERSTH